MLKSFFLAFSTYSIFPTPRTDWDAQAMRRAVCFFPLIGAVIGAAEFLWALLCERFLLPEVLCGAIAAALPLLISGGIHMDGFCDTVDALASHQSRERKLEILKDSHTGAFAIIFCALWLLCDFAAWCCLPAEDVLLCAFGFVLSRALSGFVMASWPCARKDGMLRTLADGAEKRTVRITMGVYVLLCAAGLLLLGTWRGAVVLALNALMLLIYRRVSLSQFGGVTGDLAGWFLQLAELLTALGLALTAG